MADNLIARAVRRILLYNFNVINAINYETGNEKILASKIEGLPTAADSVVPVATSFRALNVTSALGVQIPLNYTYGTSLRPDGDYDYIVRSFVGSLRVGETVTKSPTAIIVKPDMDNATIDVTIIPLIAG